MIKPNAEKRIVFLIFISVFVGLLIWGRFFYLTIIQHEYYLAKASSIANDNGDAVPRGSIFLTDKDSLPYAAALNKELPLIYVNTLKITNPENLAKKLSPLLEIDEAILIQKLSKPDDPYEILKKKVSDEIVNAVKELNEQGIGIDTETVRYYPEGLYLSQTLGFLGFNQDGQAGQYGLEEYYDKDLSGFISSSDLVLTVDSAIQTKAGALISEAVNDWHADSGSIIVMNPKNGDIIAMASYPEFDANSYSLVKNAGLFSNPATLKRYEPGSVFKPITMAIGIDIGAVTPETQYYNTGSIQVADRIISNSIPEKLLGWQTMGMILEQSLNTGAVFVQQKIPKDVFLTYLQNFGVDSKTGIDIPEINSDLSQLLSKRDVNYATASFGQGVAVTPIELLRALSAIANGGKLVRPHLVSKIISRDSIMREIKNETLPQIISSETSAKLIDMMIKVVENGSGRQARIKGYTIAGKTGTAQIPNLKEGGYLSETIHTFVAFAPAYNPRFIALIKLDKPKNVRFSESTVVSVFRDLAQFMFNYLEIPPNNPENSGNQVEQRP